MTPHENNENDVASHHNEDAHATPSIQDNDEPSSEKPLDTSQANAGEKDSFQLQNDEVMKMLEKLQLLEKENIKLKDDVLRGQAETENMKKRLSRHYEEISRENTKKLLLDIIDLLDNFERAMEASSQAYSADKSEKSIVEGIKMIEEQFIQALESKWNVSRFNSLNIDFDPQRHEAMMREVSSDVQTPIVSMEFSKGYMLGDKVLRPAKVKVTTPE